MNIIHLVVHKIPMHRTHASCNINNQNNKISIKYKRLPYVGIVELISIPQVFKCDTIFTAVCDCGFHIEPLRQSEILYPIVVFILILFPRAILWFY